MSKKHKKGKKYIKEEYWQHVKTSDKDIPESWTTDSRSSPGEPEPEYSRYHGGGSDDSYYKQA